MAAHYIFSGLRVVFCGLFLLLASGYGQAAQPAAHPLNKGEAVRVGAYVNPPKIFKTGQGGVAGFFPDILQHIADAQGFRLHYVWGTWNQCLERLQNGDIDIMVDVAYSEERAGQFDFSQETVLINWGVVYTRTDTAIESIPDLSGKTVAVMSNSIHTQGRGGIKSLAETFDISCRFLELESYDAVFEAVRSGRADAGVVNRLFGALNSRSGSLIPSPIVFNPRHLRFAFPKQSRFGTQLSQTVDRHLKELKSEPDSVFHRIIQAYLSGLSYSWRQAAPLRKKIPMSQSEKEWVRTHPAVRLGIDPEFAPFEWLSETGEFRGAAADYIRLIETRTGIRFIPVLDLSWEDTMAKARDREIDILSCVGKTRDREDFLAFSKPYLAFPRVIVTRKESRVTGPRDLPDLKVGVQANSSHLGYLKENTAVVPYTYPTFRQALMALSAGELDAVVGNLAVASHEIGKLALSNLKIAAHMSESASPLCMGIRKDWPVLRELVNRALASLTEQEKARIREKWFPVEMPAPRPAAVLLTKEETDWITRHPVIRTGIDPTYAPYSFLDRNRRFQGLAVDLMREIEKVTDLTFFPVPDLSWPRILSGAKEKKLDLILTAIKTPERDAFLNFTDIYIPTPLAIMTRGTEERITSSRGLAYKRVALVRGYSTSEKIMKEIPQAIPVTVESPLEGLNAVSMNKADAYVGVLGTNTYLIRKHGLTNLKVAGRYEDTFDGERMGVRKDWPVLAAILAKALAAVPLETKNAILRKWLPIPTRSDSFELRSFLSTAEKNWLRDHPVIRVCATPDWAPVEFRDSSGAYAGIAMEYLKQMEHHLGIRFDITQSTDWKHGGELVKKGELDMFSCAMATENRKEFAVFTQPYLEIPIVIFTHKDMHYIGSPDELKGKRVAVADGYAAQELLLKEYPSLKPVAAKNVETCLRMLERKEVDAFIGSILSAGYYIGKLKTTSLKVAGKTPFSYELSIGVRKDLAPLKEIFEKFLDLLPESEKNRIYNKWISIRYDHGTDYTLVFKLLVPVVLVLLMFVYWIQRLKLEISRREKTEAALTLAKAEADQANQSKSIFLANMSHEIRTPMNAILGYSQLLNREPGLTPDQKKSLATINRSGEHLMGLINDILELSRIEAGKLRLEPGVFDLHLLLRDLDTLFRVRIREKGLGFERVMSKDLVKYVTADEGKIRQVLTNLLGNAVKFTVSGRIVLRAASRPAGERPAPPDAPPGQVRLSFEVEDTGKGIPKSRLADIFGSFERAGAGPEASGTGLGLSISRQYARLMSGDIRVKSRVNKGSVFTFTCRAGEADPGAYSAPEAARRVTGLEDRDNPPRVLIADDRETNRDLLKKMLAQVGFDTREAVDGQEALDQFTDWQPDIVLMDLVMPKMDGFTAIREIRKLPGGKEAALIAVTASVLKTEEKKVLAAGADGFLRKPFRENQLFDLMALHGSVRFVYADDSQDAGPLVSPEPEADKSLDLIPDSLYDNMKDAMETGHIKAIHSHIDRIATHDKALADALRNLADRFDFKAMQELMEKTRPRR